MVWLVIILVNTIPEQTVIHCHQIVSNLGEDSSVEINGTPVKIPFDWSVSKSETHTTLFYNPLWNKHSAMICIYFPHEGKVFASFHKPERIAEIKTGLTDVERGLYLTDSVNSVTVSARNVKIIADYPDQVSKEVEPFLSQLENACYRTDN